MKYLTFGATEKDNYRICFLVPMLNHESIERCYIDPYLKGYKNEILIYSLLKHPKRTPVQIQRDYLDELVPILHDLDVEYLVVCDAEYFRTLTKGESPENLLGYVVKTQGDYAGFKILYCPNFSSIFYNPDKVKTEIERSMNSLTSHLDGSYVEPGHEIIKFRAYPKTADEIEDWLIKLYDMNCPLTADIETFSLKHYSAGIGTISFAWSKHDGIAFAVDLNEQGEGPRIRAALRKFFCAMYERETKLIWHNISFDVYVLIYQLFMKGLLDIEGLLKGLKVLLTNWDCTKLITYLATNSCAGNKLGLKQQAQEFAGKYAVDGIEDIQSIPLDKLLEYNLIDALSTWFVYEKHWDTLVQDQQQDIYETIFKPSILDIVQMQLTGLPIDRQEVLKLKGELTEYSDLACKRIQENTWVQDFILQLNLDWVYKRNTELKVKRVTLSDAKETFNPNSAPQLQRLIYDEAFMNLPIIDLTDTKLPATGADTLEKLVNHTDDSEIKIFLEALIDYKSVDKILSSFIPAFLEAPQAYDGWHYLFGFFNLGGTVSGRLSSSDPNLQNLPATGRWAKAVKKCFKAPPGWLFVGLDFNSLEDMISALTTKDPNKIKVYTDGYDGHCLRAYSYFGNQMPDIDPSSVDSINSIQKKYKSLRQESKVPTFLLTYGGTYHGIVGQLGWSQGKAQEVESRYHDLYQASDEWVAEKLQKASQTGYVTVAFGLRVRTPLLNQVILNNRKTPYEAEAEGRTAGNALGQSWCLLNNRAASEFMGKVRSGEYSLDIKPCAQIHDAQYYLIRADIEILIYVNTHLVRAVKWQDHPDIWHDTVKLGGELSVFYPDWSSEFAIPNEASQSEIETLALNHINEYSD